MNELVTQPQQTATPTRATGPQPIYPHDFDSAWRMAGAISLSGLAPKGIETREAIFTAIQLGAEVGLSPMSALQNIAVVNGRPTIWGDAQLALVRASGLLVDFVEKMEGEGDNMVATCIATRKGYATPSTATFSVADARKAGLWDKTGPWKTNPKRMLQMRARAFALRDGFTDILKGIYSTEEARDIPKDTMTDVTPMATSDDLNREFLAGEQAEATTQASEPVATESATAPTENTVKPVKPKAEKKPAASDPASRKKSAEELLDNLQAADPADRDDILAKAGGQAFLMQLNKDGLYDTMNAIKKAAGI